MASDGLCECGCGQIVPLAKRTYRRKGVVKGQPRRFLAHHHGRKGLDKKFWAKIAKDPTTGCWLWTGTLVCGYGQLVHEGKQWRAHRLSYILRYGPISPELFVCHNCPGGDNPRCVNPDHLFLDTPLVNARDKIIKGTVRNGRDINTAKLTPEAVVAVREARHSGVAAQLISAQFHISLACVYQICAGRSWVHVGGPLSTVIKRKRS